MSPSTQTPPLLPRDAAAAGPARRPPPITGRPRLVERLSALKRRTLFDPYWTDRRHLQRAVASLAPQARGRLLDVGVGERPYAALFAEHVRRYVGLEYPPSCESLSPGITGELQARLRGAVDVWGDAHSLPFPDDAFDTVLCLEMLEHVPDPRRCVDEIARVLRPDGRLLLTVPFVATQHALPYDFWRYTPGGVRALLEQGGLEVLSLRPRGNVASAAASLVAQYLVRAWAARVVHRDGSVSLSAWRGPLVLPLVALTQACFALAETFTRDDSASLGWTVVATPRPAGS